jgi:hypothetical protein
VKKQGQVKFIALKSAVFKRLVGQNANAESASAALRSNGMLVRTSRDSNTGQLKIAGKLERCYCIKVKFLDEDIDSTIAAEL